MIRNNERCPLCKELKSSHVSKCMDVEYGTSSTIYTYVECLNCTCVYLIDPPVDKLNLIYPPTYYSVTGPSTDSFISRLLEMCKLLLDRRLFRNIILQIKSPNINVLDIGGGSGWILDTIRTISNKVSSTSIVDLDQKSCLIASEKGHRFYNESIESYTQKKYGHIYELVLMLNLIEHVADPINVLKCVNQIMADNGILLLKTPNTASFNKKIFSKRYWGGFHAPRHWVLFNRENLRSAAEIAGFEVLQIRLTQGAPQWAASILGSFTKYDLVKLSAKPLVQRLPFSLLCLIFSIFDFLTIPFLQSDQIIATLRKRPSFLN